ncbi:MULTISPECIES: MBL fold metallo-hydrolase [Kordiimonas]|jgi:glyoxylase-like metal-dependent hydrolase (beta-lactamase superfamily II)|uniref:Glyoxylase, beta-lactamase superfamily II n=1 Tax=Kordiimonas lacus TaxID=637679 RepID=A0A1G7DCT4_9PROT|nr:MULTISPECIES: MBL fold metallo-hydrolase [Kordiimonas]SDE49414.1 Glyoxylase, beta-lactamase superfamily II [Kordiimonas lacus]
MLKAQIVPVTAFQQNCSIIWCDETMEGAFVDPGGEAEKLLQAAKQLGVDVKQILLTHGHLDHAGGAKDIKEQLGLPIIGPHKDDKFWLDGIEEHAANYNMPGLRCCTPDQWLDDGDEVTVGNVTLQVIHAPGHTPGHVVFFEPTHKVAFVGDVLFKGSIGRTDFPRGNMDDLVNAITKKLWPLGNEVTFVPGHGPLSTFGAERQSNPFVGDQALRSA